MTEVEWIECTDPSPMLECLRGRASDRKLRLIACGCCRTACRLLAHPSSLEALLASEEYADGRADEEDMKRARRAAAGVARGDVRKWTPAKWASDAAACAASVDIADYLDAISYRLKRVLGFAERTEGEASRVALLGCVFANPFRPITIDPIWLTPTVISLATAAYDERALPSGELEPARLAVLSDALEEVGCGDEDVLAHLRSPGPHARGCWVVDLLLGKS